MHENPESPPNKRPPIRLIGASRDRRILERGLHTHAQAVLNRSRRRNALPHILLFFSECTFVPYIAGGGVSCATDTSDPHPLSSSFLSVISFLFHPCRRSSIVTRGKTLFGRDGSLLAGRGFQSSSSFRLLNRGWGRRRKDISRVTGGKRGKYKKMPFSIGEKEIQHMRRCG